MSEVDNSTGQSMDDILASIRRIISEDGAPSHKAGKPGDEARPGAAGDSAVGGLSGRNGVDERSHDGDDLRDILEPVMRAETSPAEGGAGGFEAAGHDWPFDEREAVAAVPVPVTASLKDKLASLDREAVAQPVGPRDRSGEGAPRREPDAIKALAGLTDGGLAGGREAGAGGRAAVLLQMGDVAEAAVMADAIAGRVAHGGTGAAAATKARVPRDGVDASGGDADRGSPIEEAETVAAPVAGDAPVGDVRPVGVAGRDGAPGGRQASLEAVVVEALKPMLQGWLDDNLERLVAEKVDREIARLAREGRLTSRG